LCQESGRWSLRGRASVSAEKPWEKGAKGDPEIFITEGQAVDPLRHQLSHGVFNEIRIPVVPEAGRKLAHDSDALLYFSQQ
jgi:hypothetical protein